jgi:tripartite-type tricarboxylate transporter receptor subunit TctC
MKMNTTKFHLKLFAVMIMLMLLTIGVCGRASAATDEASDFPKRELTIVVPYDAGGVSDMISRIIASGLEKALNCTVLVVNRSGGTGSVGMTFVRQSRPDGYTICYTAVDVALQKILGISDVVPDDFAFIGQAVEMPTTLSVHVDSPFNTAQEFIDYAKKNPGKVTIGVGSAGGVLRISAALLERATDTKLNKISFGGGAAAVTSLMGKHVDAVIVYGGEVLSGVNAGRLKLLGTMTEERMAAAFADVPTLKELGIDVVVGSSASFAVAKDTPQPIVDKLSAALAKAVEFEEFKDFITQRGMIVRYRNATDTKKFLAEQSEFFDNMLSTMDIE